MSSNIVVKTEVQKIVVKNADGKDGKSAYMQAVEGGYTGTEQEFNCSLSLLSDVADGKKQIADAINLKGGSASADSSFAKLAEDIESLPYAGISAEGIVQTEEFSFLDFLLNTNDYIKEINDNTIKKISSSYCFYYREIKVVKLNAVESILSRYSFANSNIESLVMENLVGIYGSHAFANSQLKEIKMPSVQIIDSSQFVNGASFLTNIEFGVLSTISEMVGTGSNLRNITIGQDTDINLSFNLWFATNVINEGQSGIDELNNNLRTNLLEKLYDHSTDGQTRTLRIGWLARVTQENIDYANSKGWTLTT